MHHLTQTLLLLLLTLSFVFLPRLPVAAQATVPFTQTAQQSLDEARTIYLTNLKRREHGLGPVRANHQLTMAARWFAWDSVERRAAGFCGHTDSEGTNSSARAVRFGYKGRSGWENAYCGYVTPEQAVEGWRNSPGHWANIIRPDHREVGLGYYRRASDGRGYVSQIFGNDPIYPPVIIENEAPSTSTPQVRLYIYSGAGGSNFGSLGQVTETQISNDPSFAGASWQPYATELAWELLPGSGWRTVYVKLRDAFGRTVTVSDTIYLGTTLPVAELSLEQMSTTAAEARLYGLAGGQPPQVQLSAGWLADESDSSFKLWWGNGEKVNDAQAWGGSAFRLRPGNGNSFAWIATTEMIKDTPLMAYVRAKVSTTGAAQEIFAFKVETRTQSGAKQTFGPLRLKGTDFNAADSYQEFALPFTFANDPEAIFLTFGFERIGTVDVTVDAVTVFTASQLPGEPLLWSVPGGNYRGQGIWMRRSDGGSQFTPFSEVRITPSSLQVSTASLTKLLKVGETSVSPLLIAVTTDSPSLAWQVSSDAAWLTLQTDAGQIEAHINPAGLAEGTHQAAITITSSGLAEPLRIPLTLTIIADIRLAFLPLARR